MAKPIFLVGIPHEAAFKIQGIQKSLEQQLTDYHPLIYIHNKDEIEFRAVYEKDFDEIKFEELKEIVRGSVHKKAINADEACKIQEQYEGKPHGYVQWKGTDACMEIYCKCGHCSHIDAYFAYHVKCPKCGTVYMCNGHIELIELEQEPETCVIVPELYEE